MLVFISWSGQRSKAVAEALETWLAQVIQAVEPWISQDIDKGLRWGAEIADRLERSKVGIICLTKSNLDARWIHFEAGALSKTKDAYVCTLLLDIKPSDVEQPLAQFQHTTTEKEDIFQLLSTINRAVQSSGEKALAESILREIFETYWPRLKEAFEKSATLQASMASPSRTADEVLQEMLEILRNQERRQAGLDENERLRQLDSINLIRRKWANASVTTASRAVNKDSLSSTDPEKRKSYIDKYGLDNFLIDGYDIDEGYVKKGLIESTQYGGFLDYISRYPNLDEAGRNAIAFLYTLNDSYLENAYNISQRKVLMIPEF
ncbi:MAG: hypothetical protein QOG71_3851 [Pyrinomonadaceae bacterium]|nr:hypothetical protein [Pyrinomonadaceae bacterium]